MPANLAKAQLGRFQTRLSRLVDLVASHSKDVPVPGKFGVTRKIIIWSGLLYNSNGKSVDSIFEWSDDGAFLNQRGVSHPSDLALFMRPLTDEELAAGRARLPSSMRPVTADAQDVPDVDPKFAADFRARAK